MESNELLKLERKSTIKLGCRITEPSLYRKNLEICVSIGDHRAIADGKCPAYSNWVDTYDSLIVNTAHSRSAFTGIDAFLEKISPVYAEIIAWELVYAHSKEVIVSKEAPEVKGAIYSSFSEQALRIFEKSLRRDFFRAKLENKIRSYFVIGI